jgi:4-alpha-glucanotransferase
MNFSHGGKRLSGLVAPLSAMRGAASPGCGEFPDLADFGRLASAWGFELVQLLPINDSGTQSSPYFSLSAFALNPIYLRIGDLPELAPAAGKAAGRLRAEAEELAQRYAPEPRVPYERLLADKAALLRRVWDEAGGASAAELDAWIEARDWVGPYAAFVALKARNRGAPWWEWAAQRDPSAEDIAALWRDPSLVGELRFHAWVQMRASEQMLAASRALAALGVELMGDIPILMNADSADVWADRRFFRLDLSAGAPPDMYAGLGQNWGFPVYDWAALEREGFSFWERRLREADTYYSCYRIDHVLGFFRIWSLGSREMTGYLGRFVPDAAIGRTELAGRGFSPERLRWLSRPHVPTWKLVQAAGEAAAKLAASSALSRIGDEELFLFKEEIRGEKDIEALPSLSPAARGSLEAAWRDRVLFEFEPDAFVPAWAYSSASAWPSLSDQERSALEALFREKREAAEREWEATGRRLLGVLAASVPMMPCAEDLGSVPDCVPRVLGELGIPGLRVLRWTRAWAEPGQPYVPVDRYPELSVACPSVHDSSSLREWWEAEADREAVWSLAAGALGRELGACPASLGPDEAELLLELVARSSSIMAAYPIQDLIAMSARSRPKDPREERINVPGTVGGANWAYRMPVGADELLADKALSAKARKLAKARRARGKEA